MVNIGLGFMRQVSQGGTQLRLDARYRIDQDEESISRHEQFEDWLVNLGLAIPFGAAAAPEPEPAPEPVAEAAPAPAPAPEPAPVVDSDADGVPDDKDACAGTAVGAKVDPRGCELDSDGDGVVDSKDACAGTAPGTKVDVKGCEIPEVITLHGVNFVTGSDKLLPESRAVLDGVAETLIKHPEMRVEVAGYTDSTGSRAFNERLSYRRAKMVRSYLITKGVAPDNLTAKGYGPADPVASNSTAEGRAQNRRVELHILSR
ncbi:MAG TPA: OmpA family protein [Gammaproteobacteria bacterium]|nr:OmpA family protein [Gammaproteobacteria bacterium]